MARMVWLMIMGTFCTQLLGMNAEHRETYPIIQMQNQNNHLPSPPPYVAPLSPHEQSFAHVGSTITNNSHYDPELSSAHLISSMSSEQYTVSNTGTPDIHAATTFQSGASAQTTSNSDERSCCSHECAERYATNACAVSLASFILPYACAVDTLCLPCQRTANPPTYCAVTKITCAFMADGLSCNVNL